MKKRFLIPIISISVVLIAVLGSLIWWSENTKAVSGDKKAVSFIIPKGKSASEIGNMLYQKGLIRTPLIFKIYLQLSNRTKTVQAGEFELSPSQSLPEIVDSLYKGPVELSVTIPEGLRREEIVDRIIAGLGFQGTSAELFRSEFLLASKNKEGYLFPSTYFMPIDINASKLVDRLTETFQNKLVEAKGSKVTTTKLSLEESVILASLIERETKTDEERSIVAGILINRLNIGMPLQVDASVQYALASAKCLVPSACNAWWPTVLLNDLEMTSPYNTYKRTGLPPAPICNPGQSSLKAAFFPEETSYLFYIHDTTGQIHYAKTLSEHNANIRKYLGR